MTENIYQTTQEINNKSAQVSSTAGYSPYTVLYPHNTFSLNNISQNNVDDEADTQINQQLTLDNYHHIPSVPPSTPTYSKDEGFDFSTLGGTSILGYISTTNELQLNNTLPQMNNINNINMNNNMLPFMSTSETINLTWPIQNLQNQYVNIAPTMDTEENSFSSNPTIINNNNNNFNFDEFVKFDDDDNDMTGVGIEADEYRNKQNYSNNNNPGNFLLNEFQNLKLDENK